MRVVLIGSGNLATRLSLRMREVGIEIVRLYSHTPEHAERLAKQLGCPWTTCPEALTDEADLYLFSLKDSALRAVVERIPRNDALWAHTAGSMPLGVFEGCARRQGVLYPLQTFSRSRAVDFSRVPCFVEANSPADERLLLDLAGRLCGDVRPFSSEKRRTLHLAAVFACNFTNHMYALADSLLAEEGLPFDLLLPLIDETAAKVHAMSPAEAQTGPAIRYDENVIGKQLALLEEPELRDLYERISRSIHARNGMRSK